VQKPRHQQNKKPKTTKRDNLKIKPQPNSENNIHIYMITPPKLKTTLDIHNYVQKETEKKRKEKKRKGKKGWNNHTRLGARCT